MSADRNDYLGTMTSVCHCCVLYDGETLTLLVYPTILSACHWSGSSVEITIILWRSAVMTESHIGFLK